MTMTTIEKPDVETIEDTSVIPYVENDDPSLRTHIINPPMNLHIFRPGMETQDIVDIARTWGVHVVALCGYQWIPRHNPEKYDVCQKCFDIAGEMMRENGE